MKLTVLKRTAAMIAALLMMTAVFSACGADEEAVTETDATTAVTTTTTVTAAPTEAVTTTAAADETTTTEEEVTTTTTTTVTTTTTTAPTAPTVPKYLVDRQALQEVAATQDCDVEIVSVEIVEDVSGLLSLYGNDGRKIMLRNNTDTEVTSIVLYSIAYNAQGGFEQIVFVMTTEGPKLETITTPADFTLKAGEERPLMASCNADKVAGVELIVAEYTLADGTVVKNEVADQWTEVGVIPNPDYIN